MNEIAKIKSKIEGLETMIQSYKDQFAKTSSNSLSFTIDSLEGQLEQLQDELFQENRKREKEVVVLHLTGHQAHFGSLPLLTVSDLTEDLAKGIFQISKFIQYGNTNPKNSNKIIQETIDLRLYDVQRGSTKLLISGSTAPDLFGNSILQESLDSMLDFLNSESQDQLMDSIQNVGQKSIPHISNLLKTLNENDLELNLIWDSPEMEIEQWKGTSDKIITLYNSLTALESNDPVSKHYVGELITLSTKRKLEIRTEEEGLISISVPQNMKEIIKDFNVGGFVTCEVDVIKSTISSTGKEKTNVILRSIQENTPPNNI